MPDATRRASHPAGSADSAVATDDTSRPIPVGGAAAAPRGWDLEGLLAFRRLDLLLADAVTAAGERFGAEAAADSFRGLYLSEEQIRRGLLVAAGLPLAAQRPPSATPPPTWAEIEADNAAWAWLRRRFGLGDLELDVVLVAFAPDVDRRYEQLYAYLQDDVSARRPTVHLALDLLTTSPAQRLSALRVFAPDAPLLGHRLLALRVSPRTVEPPLVARLVAVDEQIVTALMGLHAVDQRVAVYARLVREPAADGGEGIAPSVALLVAEAWGRRPLRLCLHGSGAAGSEPALRGVAAALGAPLLVVDAAALVREAPSVPQALALALREAELHGALVYLDRADSLRSGDGGPGEDDIAGALAEHRGVVVMSASRPWASRARHPLGVLNIPVDLPTAAARRAFWADALSSAGGRASAEDVAVVADRFRLTPGLIRDAALTATAQARLRAARPASAGRAQEAPLVTRSDLFTAARQERGQDLLSFARGIRLVHGWGDLVVPDDVLRQLHELTARLEHRTRVLNAWGFERKLSGGTGITALFAGPSGTGKTMAAGVIAAELGLDLFAIDLSTVVSKYIGETEKNLSRVFDAASDTDAVLFFDEADALFGKRSEVRDAHDRYANIEIAYLLQRMEQYDGLAVLATNLRHHLDDAFTRRLGVIVDFPFPGESERERIWRACLPPELPLAADVDLTEAAQFRLAGGNIRNAALGAAYLAAADGAPVGRRHLVDAVRREYQKIGKILADPDP
ncbi:ATP-binding protein [Frankia sp. CiP3]|uniref:ATP-binding protein n=1 Tax=Frankia sp. CiP3 TaxID=2880971 RepID=UPI001EF714E2|nr:ATP-binding protein [Frankia sp. CiP3]